MLIGDIITYNSQRHPNKVALAYGDESVTYSQLERESNKIARLLAGLDVGPGQRVALIEDTNINCIEGALGIIKTGATLVCINNLYGSRELEKILRDCDPSVIIFGRDYREKVQFIPGQLPHIKHLICMGECNFAINLLEEMQKEIEERLNVAISEDNDFMVLYTAGTTGQPKGAIYTHKAFWQNLLLTIIDTYKQTYNERWIGPIPMYHIGGFGTLMRIFLMSNAFYLKSKFDSSDYLRTIEKEKITILYAYPTMINAMVNDPQCSQFDLSSLRLVIYAGSPIPENILRRAHDLFKCDFLQRYGATECCGSAILILSPDDHRSLLVNNGKEHRRLQSAGKPSLGTMVKLVDPNGQPIIEPWRSGILLAKLSAHMEGYWRDPEETSKVLCDGWLRLGDIAQFDEQGFYYLVDREKDMIVSGARNIYPREVEEVLYTHPAVKEACVIGVPDDYWGEAVKAVVALKQPGSASESQLIDFCKAHLASYKKPKSVDFVESLPKNPGGKILKKDIRQKYWEGRERLVN